MSRVVIECPSSWEFHQNACYRYGSHTSYEDAQSICERDDARLVDVDNRNNPYVKKQVKTYGGGNDFWIGSYFKRGKRVKKKGSTGCPIIRGQQSSSGSFALVNCNPSYRYICQKYGGNPPPGSNSNGNNEPSFVYEAGPDGESEVPISTSSRPVSTSTAVAENTTNSQVIPAVVSVILLVLAALVLRFLCKRRTARRLKNKKLELKREQEKKEEMRRLGSTITGVSRTTSVHKPFGLPIGESRLSSTISRNQKSVLNGSGRRSMRREGDDDGYQSRGGYESRREPESKYRRYSKRSPSIERNLHGVHSPSPPYDRRRRTQSESRSRSVSRRRTPSEYTESSRSSSADSRHSESAISTVTENTFRRSGHHRSRDFDRGYSRSTTPSRARSERAENQHYGRHQSHQRRHERGRHHHSRHHDQQQPRSQTMYDRYAAAPPPMSAHEMLTHLQERGRSGYGGYSRPEPDFSRPTRAATTGRHYFPQMTNVMTWSDEDLSRFEGQQPLPKQAPRFPRQGPIRVNRHIHDYEGDEEEEESNARKPSDQSDHIYESLDEMARNSGGSAVPGFQRDVLSRGSTKSRSSMHGRKLPAVPSS